MSLQLSYQIINDPDHEPVRQQIQMAVWTVAVAQKLDPNTVTSGPAYDLILRVLLGDMSPITLVLYTFATDEQEQAKYVDANHELPDEEIISYVQGVWRQISVISTNM